MTWKLQGLTPNRVFIAVWRYFFNLHASMLFALNFFCLNVKLSTATQNSQQD